ncbi:MAG: hypothetical protein ACKO6N_02980 [Myxococcota bacterium]
MDWRERLRQWLAQQERSDDPRHARGRARAGVRVWTSEGVDLHQSSLPMKCFPVEQLVDLRPELGWDVSACLYHALEQAQQHQKRGVLLSLSLDDCLLSARLEQSLSEGRALWEVEWQGLHLRLGSRMQKAWVRRLKLGEAVLSVLSLPLTLLLEHTSEGVRVWALALDPLGPSREARRLKRLLRGESLFAPGTEQERMPLEKGSTVVFLGHGEPPVSFRVEQPV